ncbi:MAG: hypothetical protein PVG65_05560 [Candidatus Thorarchaeota archaeon]
MEIKTTKEKVAIFKEWSKELCRWDRNDWFIHWTVIPKDYNTEEVFTKFRVYTRDNVYGIGARFRTNGRDYLGCTVSKRKPRAGEDWTRGNDLPDGPFNRKTWEKIKDSIIQYELVKIIKPIRYMVDEEKRTEEKNKQ